MKKIVHVVPTFDLGGVQTGILYSLRELRKKYDYKVVVISFIDHQWLTTQPKEIREQIIWSGSNNLFIGWIRAYSILKKENPDILISSLWKSVVLTVVYKLWHKKTQLIGFYHTSRYVHRMNNFFLKIMGRVQNGAFADSLAVKKYIEEQYGIQKTDVIPFHFKFNEESIELKKFNPEDIKLCYFGRLNEQKGVYRSLMFCKLLKTAGVRFKFELYGEGKIEELKNIIKRYNLEHDVFINDLLPLDQVLSCMKKYDFLLQLSNHEGMALSVVEAMSVGLVPIVTPVGEIANYSKDGYNAIWLNPNFEENLENLVYKVKKEITDKNKYNQMSIAARCSFTEYQTYCEAMMTALERIEN